MGNIRVSIIVPVFNMQSYLPTCIESIMNQTLKEIEIILVDDGSTDTSLDICKEYAARDKRIQVFTQVNSGVSSARNKGLDVARGEYIGFVDADDCIEKEMYEEMYRQAIVMNGEAVVCSYVTSNACRQHHGIMKEILEQEEIDDFILDLIGPRNLQSKERMTSYGSACVYLYKRELIEAFKIRFNQEIVISEDFLFNLDILSHIRRLVINQGEYYHYRRNTLSATQKYRETLWQEVEQLLMEMKELLKNKLINEKFKERIYIARINYLIKAVKNECHRENNKAYKCKVNTIKQMCSEADIDKALRSYNTKDLSMSRKIWFMLYRFKWSRMLYIYYQYIAR